MVNSYDTVTKITKTPLEEFHYFAQSRRTQDLQSPSLCFLFPSLGILHVAADAPLSFSLVSLLGAESTDLLRREYAKTNNYIHFISPTISTHSYRPKKYRVNGGNEFWLNAIFLT